MILHLLSVEPGRHAETIAQMRFQLPKLVVVGTSDCCPTVDLAFGFDNPPANAAGPPLVEARHRSRPWELLLFHTEAGDIRTLELVHDDLDHVDELPAPEAWSTPTVYGSHRGSDG